jgi:hypothetical protein
MFIVSVLVLTKGLHYVACGKKESDHPSESLVKSKKVLKVKCNSLVGGTENCKPFSNSKVSFGNCVQKIHTFSVSFNLFLAVEITKLLSHN